MTTCRSHSARPHLRRPNFLLVLETGRWRGRRQRRPRCRSGHLHKTRTEPGQMADTNAGAIPGVHCRPQARQSFAAVRWSSFCRVCTNVGYIPSWWRMWCCGGLPPPGKGPSPAVWGEGLSRTSLDAGLGVRSGWSNVGLCGDIRGCVCSSARGAAGSKQSAASPAELAPQGALAAKTVAPTTVLSREIVPGTGQRRGLGAQEDRCGCPYPRRDPGLSPGSGLRSGLWSDGGRRRWLCARMPAELAAVCAS